MFIPKFHSAVRNLLSICKNSLAMSGLVICMPLLTVGVWYVSYKAIEQKNQDRFTSGVNQIHVLIEKRIIKYEQVLRSGVGLFYASDGVSRKNWHDYVNTLDVGTYYPGIQGLGYSIFLRPSQLKKHIHEVRSEGFQGYSLWPQGDREFYTSIVYLEPFADRNLRAFGYDMFSEPIRRKAMERARDTGAPSISGFVRLVQETEENRQRGFLFYLPVYKNGVIPATIAERRQNLMGFVYAPFRMNDLMNGVLGNRTDGIGFEVYDLDDASGTSSSVYKSDVSNQTNHEFEQSVQIAIGGHKWRIRVYSLPGFVDRIDKMQPPIILLFGLIINILFFTLVISFFNRKKDIELLVASLTAELKEKTVRMELALEGSQDGIWDWDVKRNLVFFSRQWKSLLGYREDEIKNEFQSWLDLLHPEDKERALETVRQFQSSTDRVYNLEHRLRRKDGSYSWILSKGVGLRDSTGQIYRMAGSHKDITERKETEKFLINAKDQALSVAKLKTDFLASMSHEIRTPLNGIIGMAELLHLTPLSEVQVEYVETLKESSYHLRALVDDILSLSKIESGYLDLNMSGLSLEDLLLNIQRKYKVAADMRGIGFSIIRDTQPHFKFYGDIVRINQILFNLLDNAIKFTEKGSVCLRVFSVWVEENRYHLSFEVVDTGIGISEIGLSSIFEPFVQGDSSTTKKYGGTGLGLTISKKLATLMGGEIKVQSRSGRGSTFTFALIVEVGYFEAEVLAEENHDLVRKTTRPLQILIAEDHPTNQKVLTRMIEMYGHTATVVPDGLAALEALKVQAFDLVLMDCHMPRMDGITATQIIRQLGSVYSEIPVIGISADILSTTRDKCFAAGMNAMVAKPLNFLTLFLEIEKSIPIKKTSAAPSNATETSGKSTIDSFATLDPQALKKLRSLNRLGDKDFAEEMIEDFVRTTPEKIAQMIEFLQKEDLKACFSMAHSLKSSAATIGALDMRDMAEVLEQACTEGRLGEVKQYVQALSESFHSLRRRLDLTLDSSPEGHECRQKNL